MSLSLEEINELMELANSGDTSAQIELAARYATGDEIEQNTEKAVFWYEKAATENDPIALYNLGLMYLFGEGVDQNQQKGIRLLNQAAELADHDAHMTLGDAYAEGNLGLQQDWRQAAAHYLSSCPIGASRGIRSLGKLITEHDINVQELARLMLNR